MPWQTSDLIDFSRISLVLDAETASGRRCYFLHAKYLQACPKLTVTC